MKIKELKNLISQVILEELKKEFSTPAKLNGMEMSSQHKMMWAEHKDNLPSEEKISDVKIPFKILKFPTFDSLNDCLVFIEHVKNGQDPRDILIEKSDIDLEDPYLFATQDNLYLSKEELKNHHKKQHPKPPIVVSFPNGVKLIQDGHHRLSVAKILGEKKVKSIVCNILDWNDIEPETEEFIKSIGPNITETNAVGGMGVSATSGGNAWTSQKDNHELLWKEETLGKKGDHGPTYFQIGGSLPDNLYNRKNGKPSRDPGVMGLNEEELSEIIKKCGDKWCLYTKHKQADGKRRRLGTHSSKAGAEAQERAIKANENRIVENNAFYHGTTVDLEPGEYILPPNDTSNISEKGRKKNLDRVFFTSDLGSAKIYAGRAKHSLGGNPKVYLIKPEGNIDTINATPGSTVFMAPKAKVIKKVVESRNLKESNLDNKNIIAYRSGNSYDFKPAQGGTLGPGYYFTTNPKRAEKYGNGNIVTVKISLNNPYIVSKEELGKSLGFDDYMDIDTGAYDSRIGNEINKLIKNNGYDGIIATEKNGKTHEILVFDKNSFEPANQETK